MHKFGAPSIEESWCESVSWSEQLNCGVGRESSMRPPSLIERPPGYAGVAVEVLHLRESIRETFKREPPSTRKGVKQMDEPERIRRHLGEVFKDLGRHRESRIEEGYLMPDHVHMMISALELRMATERWPKGWGAR